VFAYEDIVYQPAFYLLIAFTIVLTLGFSWGRRWNKRVLMNALDPLLEIFRARDQQFTNIGGQTGFHANIIPGNVRTVRRIDVTITLLPRQSWLYMPFSLATRRFDRMQTIFFFNKRGRALREEAHLIDARFERMMGNRIENAGSLSVETVEWGGRTFHIYSAGAASRAAISDLQTRLGEPRTLRHAAIVPQSERAYAFVIPRHGTVPPVMTAIRDWLNGLVAEKDGEVADTAAREQSGEATDPATGESAGALPAETVREESRSDES
jgi:hypothetical protein